MADYSKIRAAFDDNAQAVVLFETVLEGGKPADLVICYANPPAAKLWDTVPGDMVGRTLHEVGRDLDGRLLDVHQELLINGRPRTVYDYSTARDRHLRFDCFYYDPDLTGCRISDADLEPGATFTPAMKSEDRPMTDLEKAVSAITKTFAVYENESYNLDNENDYICFSDIKTWEIIGISTSSQSTALSLFGKDYEGKKCYETTEGRSEPCESCTNESLSRDRFHVWQSHNEALGKDYLHRTKMVKWDGRFIRMDLAQDITDDKRKAAILTETIEGMSLWTECITLLSEETPFEDAIKMVIETLGNFFEASSGALVLYGSVIYAAGWAADGAYHIPPMFARPTGAALDEWAALMKQNAHTLISDAADPRIPRLLREHFRDWGIKSTQLNPVFIGDQLRGVICLNNVARNKGQAFLVDMVAQSVAHALRQNELQDHMTHLRFRDLLTGHLNFDGFKYAAEKLIKGNPHKRYSLWYSDVRRFKYLNDMFGYEVGDRFLQFWSAFISGSDRPGEAFCRVAADNFVALRFYDTLDDLYQRFNWVNAMLEEYPGLEGKNFRPELVTGIYLLDEEDMRSPDINKMLDKANIAQTSVKGLSGKQMAVYDDSIKDQQLRELEISQHLEEGLDNGEFFIVVQPQYRFTTNEVIGAEALVRWNHPTLGSISPKEFIPLLEKTGLISKVDLFVWEEACRFIRRMLDSEASLPVVPLSVNISRTDIYLPGLADILSGLVAQYDIPASLLNLEITESAYIDSSEQLIAAVEELRNRGFTVEMDDFGSGYSSLNTLKEVPVDVLKLDMQFLVIDDSKNERGGSILSSIIRMAHWINLPVIAEGVETREQAEYLKSLGCSMMQGYYFAEPMPLDQFEQLLACAKKGEMMPPDFRDDILSAAEFLNTGGATSFLFSNCIGGGCLIELTGADFEALLLNDQFYEVMGISRETGDSHRTHMVGLYREEDRRRVIDGLAEAAKEGTSVIYARPIRDDGEARWVRSANRYLASRDGKHMIFSLVEDVTDSYLSEEKIADAEDRFKGFETLMSGGFYRYAPDGDGSFDFVSDGLMKTLGYTRECFEERFRNRVVELIYPEDRERVLQAVAEDVGVDALRFLDFRVETSSGGLIHVQVERCVVVDRHNRRWCYGHVVEVPEPETLR